MVASIVEKQAMPIAGLLAIETEKVTKINIAGSDKINSVTLK